MHPTDVTKTPAFAPASREVGALIETYADGDCLTLAFALHWMCGWPVLAVSEPGSRHHLHFAARGPDGLAWDALGPRPFADAGAAYADEPRWEDVDVHRYVVTDPQLDEAAITRACHDAETIFGAALARHVTRRPCPS